MRTRLFVPTIGFALFASILHAQMPGSGMGSSMGTSQSTSFNQNNGQQAQKTAEADALTAIAPPFDVDDVLRMHRAGLQDEVIINSLQARYHPLILSVTDKKRLMDVGVSNAVIYAMEDPYNIGIENVRAAAEKAARDSPEVAPVKDNSYNPVLHHRSKDESAPAVSATNPETTPAPIVGVSRPPADNPTVTAGSDLPVVSPSRPHEPVQMVAHHPSGPGIYIRRVSSWVRVDEEPVAWTHRKNDPNKHVEGIVPKLASSTDAYAEGNDFLVIVKGNSSVVQYQLVHLHPKDSYREFKPAESGATYTAAGVGDLVTFNPLKLGPSSWLISLKGLPVGEYGFLPPVMNDLRSTTNLSNTLYTFNLK